MPHIKTKASMVDPNGAFTKVQERTLGKYMSPTAKNGTKITKAKNGAKVMKAKSGMKKMMGGGKCKDGC